MRSSLYSPLFLLCPLIHAAPSTLGTDLAVRDSSTPSNLPDAPSPLYNGDNCLSESDTTKCILNINLFRDGTFWWGIRNNNCDKPFGNHAQISSPSAVIQNPVGAVTNPPNVFTISNLPRKDSHNSIDENAGFQLQVNRDLPVLVQADDNINYQNGKPLSDDMTLRNVGCWYDKGPSATVKGKCYIITHKC